MVFDDGSFVGFLAQICLVTLMLGEENWDDFIHNYLQAKAVMERPVAVATQLYIITDLRVEWLFIASTVFYSFYETEMRFGVTLHVTLSPDVMDNGEH